MLSTIAINNMYRTHDKNEEIHKFIYFAVKIQIFIIIIFLKYICRIFQY